jgi:hypothetical protein
MQLEFIFQNTLVVAYVLFGMTCTVGLSVVLPFMIHALVGVFGAVFTEIGLAKAQGRESGSVAPEDLQGGDEIVVIGYPPGHTPAAVAAPGPVEYEPDDVPTGMLVKLAVAVTIAAVVSVIGGFQLFKFTLSQELAEKGHEQTSGAIPRASAD